MQSGRRIDATCYLVYHSRRYTVALAQVEQGLALVEVIMPVVCQGRQVSDPHGPSNRPRLLDSSDSRVAERVVPHARLGTTDAAKNPADSSLPSA